MELVFVWTRTLFVFSSERSTAFFVSHPSKRPMSQGHWLSCCFAITVVLTSPTVGKNKGLQPNKIIQWKNIIRYNRGVDSISILVYFSYIYSSYISYIKHCILKYRKLIVSFLPTRIRRVLILRNLALTEPLSRVLNFATWQPFRLKSNVACRWRRKGRYCNMFLCTQGFWNYRSEKKNEQKVFLMHKTWRNKKKS